MIILKAREHSAPMFWLSKPIIANVWAAGTPHNLSNIWQKSHLNKMIRISDVIDKYDNVNEHVNDHNGLMQEM